ncbi:hypothetical protein SAMN05444580_101129 [Rhodococcus tukisamuensis]|uniref:Uncharacterized protein n=1 Tax=Rhodococcus tukisamuensis TaxID=168276 RepID=A0A1G6MCE1_9NOCA|nr:hypothetical protein SAMN05444580_101129 [Rhodococcus tukisamuensis]
MWAAGAVGALAGCASADAGETADDAASLPAQQSVTPGPAPVLRPPSP